MEGLGLCPAQFAASKPSMSSQLSSTLLAVSRLSKGDFSRQAKPAPPGTVKSYRTGDAFEDDVEVTA